VQHKKINISSFMCSEVEATQLYVGG
jgi:hypothetical protein